MSRKRLIPLGIILTLIVGLFSTVAAQGTVLAYGSSLSDSYVGNPITYTFDGSEGDLITLYVIADGPLRPTLALAQSNGQPIAFSSRDALSPMLSDARITAVLPADDTYIVTLSNQDNAVTGPYTIALAAAEPFSAISLTGTVEVTIEPDGTDQHFSIAANEDAAQQVRVRELPEGFGFTAQVQSADGQILAAVTGGLDEIVFTLPAGETDYSLTVGAVDPQIGTEIEVALLDGDGEAAPPAATEDDGPAEPATTEEAQVDDPNTCVLTASGVNVRSGPSTDFAVIGSLTEGTQFIATGQNAGWFNGTFNGQSAWVAASVVEATGPCADLPTVTAPDPQGDGGAATVPPTGPTAVSTSTPPADTGAPTNPPPPTDTAPTQVPTQAPPSPTPTIAPTDVPFRVTSISCRYAINDGATVDFRVEGPASTTFTIETRFGSTVYSVDRTTNPQGFLSGNQRFGQVGNSNYVAYIVYNGQDVATAEC